MKQPVTETVNGGCKAGQYKVSDKIVAHNRFYKHSADKTHNEKIYHIKVIAPCVNIPQGAREKSEKHTGFFSFKHGDCGHKRYKNQSPCPANLQKSAGHILQNGKNENYKSEKDFSEDFIFFAFINFTTTEETKPKYYTEQIHCTFTLNEKNKVKYKSECHVYLVDAQTVPFKELYLLPYILPYQYPTAFDVLIKEQMKVKLLKEDNTDNNNTSSYNQINSFLFFFILVLLTLF